jgi:hypothetical protein
MRVADRPRPAIVGAGFVGDFVGEVHARAVRGVGHPQGYLDCFTASIADVHAAAAGARPDGCARSPMAWAPVGPEWRMGGGMPHVE